MYQRLCVRFAAPAWATFRQVSNSTGFAASRSADAISMSLYPSRGLDVYGFEIKTSRSDWLREMKDPQKAEDMAQYCDFWYLAISDKKILKPAELPDTWGLLVRHGTTLRQVKAAKRLETPGIDKPFVAALLRRANEAHASDMKGMIPYSSVSAEIADAVKRGKKQGKESTSFGQDRLLRTVQQFAEASGIDLEKEYQWNGSQVGAVVKAVLAANTADRSIKSVRRSVDELDKRVQNIKAELEGIENGRKTKT